MKPTFFRTSSEFRKWLSKNHAKSDELLLGFYKTSSGKGGITYHEALDQALAFGWIDGVRKSLGDESYTIRFTPRKKKSKWSLVNIKRVTELIDEDAMHSSGMKAYEARDESMTQYSYEARERGFDLAQQKKLESNKKARAFWEKLPPSYRHTATYWVVSAKKEETREKRLQTLIDHCVSEKRLPQFISPAKKKK